MKPIVQIIIIAAVAIASIAITYAIASSDLPLWAKFMLLK